MYVYTYYIIIIIIEEQLICKSTITFCLLTIIFFSKEKRGKCEKKIKINIFSYLVIEKNKDKGKFGIDLHQAFSSSSRE